VVTQPSCNGFTNGSILLSVDTGAGPHTYLWTTGSSDSSLTNLGAGTYSVVVTNALGCFETRSFTLSDPYFITFGGILAPTCPGETNGMATVNSSGCPCQFSTCIFLWDNGVTTKPNNALTSGWHSIVITHPGGCVVTDSVFVPEPLPIIIDTNIVNNVCFGDSLGSIELLNSNYQPVVYNWSNGEISQLVSDLSSGNYSVIVSDARGCIDSLEFLISQPAELLVSSDVTNVLCNGDANGEIQIQGQGGTGNYTYWMNQQNTSSLNTNLTSGIYSIYITDANNCSSQSLNVTINEPTSLTATLSSTPQVTSLDGTASVNVSGGTAPYTYEWNDGNNQTEVMAVYLNSGWYSVVVTDANGCQLTDSVFVESNVGLTEGKTQDILIFPNPTSEILFFNVTADKVEILDLNGRMVTTLVSSNKVDLRTLSAGNYLLKIISNDSISTHRFVKE
jgi:hypothetical protein